MQTELKTLSEQSARDISINAIKSGRMLHKVNGWEVFTYQLTDEDINAITALIGGRERTQTKVCNCLRSLSTLPFNSYFDRLAYSRSNFNWYYNAGQSYTDELQAIRNYFNNL